MATLWHNYHFIKRIKEERFQEKRDRSEARTLLSELKGFTLFSSYLSVDQRENEVISMLSD